jgi:hypothetical protein
MSRTKYWIVTAVVFLGCGDVKLPESCQRTVKQLNDLCHDESELPWKQKFGCNNASLEEEMKKSLRKVAESEQEGVCTEFFDRMNNAYDELAAKEAANAKKRAEKARGK